MPEKKCCNVVSQQQEKNHPGQKGGLDKDRHDSTPIVLHMTKAIKCTNVESEIEWFSRYLGLNKLDATAIDLLVDILKLEFTESEFQRLQQIERQVFSRSKHVSSL
jgi:hypothetical protein